MKFYFVVLIYSLLGGLGLSLLKKGLNIEIVTFINLFNKYIIIGSILYLSSFGVWIKLLRDNDLNIAFPIASGALFASILIFSYFILNEFLSLKKMFGIFLILSGILITSKG